MRIAVKLMNGRLYQLNVVSTDTLRSVKLKLQEIDPVGMKVSLQGLCYDGNQLTDDEERLRNYGIEEGSTLHLVLREEFQLFVRDLTGKTYTLELLSLETTVLEAKRQLEVKSGLKPEHQRLQFAGREMQDAAKLADYGVQRNSTLNLVMRVVGGDRVGITRTRSA